MGWRELTGWFTRMDRQKRGPEPNPDSWRNAQTEGHWEEWRQNREQARGRMN